MKLIKLTYKQQRKLNRLNTGVLNILENFTNWLCKPLDNYDKKQQQKNKDKVIYNYIDFKKLNQ